MTMGGVFSFLNASILAGAGFVAIPIIYHFINRRRFRRVRWAAMEFLLEAIEQKKRQVRIEDLILLLLRIALILLLVFGLARPTLRRARLIIPGASAKPHAVILLDSSYSMSYQTGDRSRYDVAKARAKAIISGLEKGASASLALISSRTRPLVKAGSYELELVAEMVDQSECSHGSTSIQDAVETALQIAEQSKSPNKEFYFVTDCQASGWESGADRLRELLPKLSARGRVFIVAVDSIRRNNLAIESVQMESDLVSTYFPTTFNIRLKNYGAAENQGLTLNLYVGGEKVRSKPVDIEAGDPPPVTLTYQFTPEQFASQPVRIQLLPNDGVRVDNERYLSPDVCRELKVACVDGNPGLEPFAGEADYLRFALSPEDYEKPEERTLVTTKVFDVAQLGKLRLDDYDCLILANVPKLSASMVKALDGYVRRGGGLLVFLGNLVDDAFYNRALHAQGQGLLPAKLTGAYAATTDEMAEEGQGYFGFSIEGTQHPVIERFLREDVDLLTAPRFKRAYGLETTPDSTAAVMLRYDNGRPAIVEKLHGKGRSILFPTSPSTRWGNLPLKPIFLPLVHKLIYRVTRATLADDKSRPGQTITVPVRALGLDTTVMLTPPSGRTRQLDVQTVKEGSGFAVEVRHTDEAGLYKMACYRGEPGASDASAETTSAAVNLDTTESDLRTVTDAALREMFPDFEFTYVPEGAELAQMIKTKRTGFELWRYALMAMLLIALTESLVASRFSARED